MSDAKRLQTLNDSQVEVVQLSSKEIGVLGYLSLMKIEAYIKIDNLNYKAHLKDFDANKNWCKWEVTGRQIKHVVGYVNAVLSFNYGEDFYVSDVEVISIDHFEVSTKLPCNISKINNRKSKRFAIDAKLNAKCKVSYLNINCQPAEVVLGVKSIVSVSEGGMCFVWDRKINGVLIEGMQLLKIEIYNKSNQLIFDSTGVVKWIEFDAESVNFWRVGVEFKFATAERDINTNIESQRCLERIYLNGGVASAYINTKNPFSSNKKLRGIIHDITTHGCSILQEYNDLCLPIGTVLKNVELQIPFYEVINIEMILRHISEVEIEEGGELKKIKKYGFEFVNLKPLQFKNLTRLVLESKSSNLRDADVQDLDEIWRFFFETGFIYDQKRKLIANKFDEIRKVYEILLEDENTILKKILYKNRGKIYAHVSAILHYEATWLVQHLAATKNNLKSTSIDVVIAMIDFFIQMHNELKYRSQYTQFYYRPENFYPATLFGGATRLMNNKDKAELINFTYYLLNLDGINGSSLLSVANESSFYLFEKFVLKNCSKLQFLAEGWSYEKFYLPTVSKEYCKYGLSKSRSLLYNEKLGFVVYESSDMGLNLSELTNVVKVFPFHDNLTNELVVEALKWLKGNTQNVPSLLLNEKLDGLLDPLYCTKKTTYTCWTMDLEYKKEFKKAVNDVFVQLKAKSAKKS